MNAAMRSGVMCPRGCVESGKMASKCCQFCREGFYCERGYGGVDIRGCGVSNRNRIGQIEGKIEGDASFDLRLYF